MKCIDNFQVNLLHIANVVFINLIIILAIINDYYSLSIIIINPFSTKLIFGRNSFFSFLGSFIATLVFMLQR